MLKETYEKVICFLAHKEEATQYEISNAEAVKLSYAPIHQAIKELLAFGFIEETRREKGRGPSPKRFFRLTFRGFITALALFSKSDKPNQGIIKDLRKAITLQRARYPEIKIFSEWDFFEEAFGDYIYNVLETAALCWFNIPAFGEEDLHLPTYVLKSEVLVEASLKYWLEKEKKQWQPTFVRLFFDMLFDGLQEDVPEHVLKGTPNPVLEAFIKESFEKRKAAIMKKLKKCDEREKLLLAQFGR